MCVDSNCCVLLVSVYCSVEKNQSEAFELCSLRLEECLSAERFPTAEHIQGYVKKVSPGWGIRAVAGAVAETVAVARHPFDAVAGGKGQRCK